MGKIFVGKQRFACNFFIITLVFQSFYALLFENQVSIELHLQAKCSDTARAGFPSRELNDFHKMAKLAESHRSHMSRWTGRSICK